MAASGINVKMGVEGLSQFKNNMKTAQTAVKTLDQQLKTNEAQFKATGYAEAYMEKKTELLELKLKEQKTVVTNAEKALEEMKEKGADPASAAYQKLAQEMLRAKAGMYETEAAMNGVAGAGEDAANEVDSMNQQLKRVGDGVNWQNVTDSLQRISDGIGNVIKRAWQMGEALVKNVLGAGSWADELKTTATQYEDTLLIMSGGGSSTEYLQRMRKTAALIDTDVDTILSAQDKLKKGREEANKETMGAFAYLGIDPTGKNSVDAFWEAGEAISKLSAEEDKNHYAQALFGKSWRELIPLFQAGREEYDRTMASWSVVSDDTIDSLGKMDDQYQTLNGEWETFKNEMLGAFAGPLTVGMEKLTSFVEKLNEYLSTPEGQAMLEQMGNIVTQLIEDLTNVNPEDIVNGLSSVVDGIKGGLEWISENSGTVVGAITAIIGAWGLVQVSAGITTFLKLINAIKGLTAAEAASAGAAAGSSWAGAFASAAIKAAPFLAFLYTLLNPAATAGDDLDSIWDANGNPTTVGREAGITWTRDQDEAMAEYKKAVRDANESANTIYTGDTEAAESRNSRWLESQKALDRMTQTADDLRGTNENTARSTSEMTQAANDLKGLPAATASAVHAELAGMNVYMDGEAVGRIVTPRVGSNMAGQVMAMIK